MGTEHIVEHMKYHAIPTDHIMGTDSSAFKRKRFKCLITGILCRMMDHHEIGFAHGEIGGAGEKGCILHRILQRILFQHRCKLFGLLFIFFVGRFIRTGGAGCYEDQ